MKDGKLQTVPGLKQKGVSKEHRTDPIIQGGMATTPLGVPAAIDVFAGNTHDGEREMLPFITKLFGESRDLSADKGANNVANQLWLLEQGWDFTFSQTLRGSHGKRFTEALFSPDGWQDNADGSFSWKLWRDTRETVVAVVDPTSGRKKREQRTVVTNVLFTWDAARAKRDRLRREEKVKNAEKQIQNFVYGATGESRGFNRYVKETAVDMETGEAVTDKLKKNKSVDREKAEEDAKYDGFAAIVTSEDSPDVRLLLGRYAQQLVIEQLFRNSKSSLQMRPVFVRTRAHARAHFLICFVALLVA